MKVKEYFEKHKQSLLKFTKEQDDQMKLYAAEDGAMGLLYDMDLECRQIVEKRGCKTIQAKVAVLREMNERWNKVRDMLISELDKMGVALPQTHMKKNQLQEAWIEWEKVPRWAVEGKEPPKKVEEKNDKGNKKFLKKNKQKG